LSLLKILFCIFIFQLLSHYITKLPFCQGVESSLGWSKTRIGGVDKRPQLAWGKRSATTDQSMTERKAVM